MKKFLKILGWIAGVFLVLLVLAVIGLKLFLPVDKVRQMAVDEGSARLGRDVSVEGLDVSFWGGLGVKLENVRVGNPPDLPGDDFLAAEYVDLKLQLLPLLRGDVRVDRLVIEAPRINMVKTPDGRINYEFAAVDSSLPPQAAEQITPEAKTAAIAISFDELDIVRGYLRYTDDSSGVHAEVVNFDLTTELQNPREGLFQSSGRAKIDSLRVVAGDTLPVMALELSYKAGYDIAAQLVTLERTDVSLNGLKFKVTGEIRDPMGDMALACNVKSDRITLADLFNLVPPGQREVVAGFDIEGDFSLDADLAYAATSGDLSYSGKATLSDLLMSREDIVGKLAIGRCHLDFETNNLRMTIEDGSFDGQPLRGHLVVDDFEHPVVTGELAGQFNLVFLEPFLPAGQGHRLTGRTNFDLKFSGPVEDYETMGFSGNLAITEASYASDLIPEPVQSLSADAYFDNRLLHIRSLKAGFPSGQVEFTGRVNDLVPYLLADSTASPKAPSVEGKLKGDVNLAAINSFLPPKGNPVLEGTLAMDLRFAGSIDNLRGFEPRGTLEVRNASYRDSLLPEPVERFDASMTLKPDTIEITRLNVKFSSSDVAFSGQLMNPF
ncbi:MAG: AsmA family protein, partial [candidate division Zixibacteria bacterium]|nr:AsmA family protein [candidate division Zixibacteria bacterium]